ncbi:GyrI-like domain-containing protein [Microtetraspora niveoalba]|uniref:GyrI-like domain-containing protein n=1 Tax=Microtetraspora niveoalba TaxID=46175 RepID=UPI000835CD1D|nr:GyrI-like domain-containing protein [Microtetraspora niveoalba]
MTTPKADFKKTYRELYSAGPEPALVRAPELPYLMIDGMGDPDSAPGYASAVEALYAVAYTIRFALKGAGVVEYPVMPLQGQWWTDEDHRSDYAAHRDQWRWTMMIMQPPQADGAMFDAAVATARKKKPSAPIDRVRLETLHEGWCGQILHVGPYSTEAATVGRLHAFLEEGGHAINGRHHEIYLSMPGRTAPEKMKTIIRYPVTPAG